MAKDYYEILGVGRTASKDEIKQAFRKLAHQHHPDKASGDEKKFKEINEAYQVLTNDEKRRQYDQFGSTFEQAQSGGQGFNWQDFSRAGGPFGGFRAENGDFGGLDDLGDLFGDLFGFNSSRTRTKRKTRARAGADIQAEMEIDFEEAVFGAEKVFDLYKTIICPHCRGNGAEPGTKISTCQTCKGLGQVQQVQNTILGQIRSSAVCPHCAGEGKTAEKNCKKCGGQGYIKDYQKIKVKIPAGIDNGQSIRLSGQGEVGSRGAGAGDLYLIIRVKPSHFFKRDGYDIFSSSEISFSQSALGTKKIVKTLDGEVELKIPAGTQSGKIFRLKGKGVPHLESSGRGDQLVEVIVKTPTRLSRRQKELLEELEEEEGS